VLVVSPNGVVPTTAFLQAMRGMTATDLNSFSRYPPTAPFPNCRRLIALFLRQVEQDLLFVHQASGCLSRGDGVGNLSARQEYGVVGTQPPSNADVEKLSLVEKLWRRCTTAPP
jgi:hypothetical protein